MLRIAILEDPGADSWARESRNGSKRKVKGKTRSLWRQRFSRVVPNGLARSSSWLGAEKIVFFCPGSEQQFSESVSCVLTQSSIRGSFVRHIASIDHRKSKALFLENRTVNVPRSLRPRRRICHVQVKNQFTEKFALIERIVLLSAIPVLLLIRAPKMAAFCLVARDSER